MWMVEKLRQRAEMELAELTKVISTNGSFLTTERSVTKGDTLVAGPMGYWGQFAVGDSVLVLPTHLGDVCVGKFSAPDAAEDEIVIKNRAGATIRLTKDGKVQINSKVFD